MAHGYLVKLYARQRGVCAVMEAGCHMKKREWQSSVLGTQASIFSFQLRFAQKRCLKSDNVKFHWSKYPKRCIQLYLPCWDFAFRAALQVCDSSHSVPLHCQLLSNSLCVIDVSKKVGYIDFTRRFTQLQRAPSL